MFAVFDKPIFSNSEFEIPHCASLILRTAKAYVNVCVRRFMMTAVGDTHSVGAVHETSAAQDSGF